MAQITPRSVEPLVGERRDQVADRLPATATASSGSGSGSGPWDANHDGVLDHRDAQADPAVAAPHLAWIRGFHHDMYRDTGGVPVVPRPDATGPRPNTDGCYINYPDVDLSDPDLNPPGVGQPWHTLHYGTNYPRLQRAKAHWDPRDVFRHRQSVRLPEAPWRGRTGPARQGRQSAPPPPEQPRRRRTRGSADRTAVGHGVKTIIPLNDVSHTFRP